jgi:hypothetical protein
MTTITRDKLQRLYTETIIEANKKKIDCYVDTIKGKILASNCNGNKNYIYTFYKNLNKENEETIKEVMRRLQEIFIDSEIIFNKADAYGDDRISIDWTN